MASWSPARLLIALVLGTGVGACFNEPAADVMFACEANGEAACPVGYTCAEDGCCHRDGTEVTGDNFGMCKIGGQMGTTGAMTGTTGTTSTTGTTGTTGVTTGPTSEGSSGETSTGVGSTSTTSGSTDETGAGTTADATGTSETGASTGETDSSTGEMTTGGTTAGETTG